MDNFYFRNPTKILFGKGMIARLTSEIPGGARVLVLYGGGSIKSNGVHEQVMRALSGHRVAEFGGIPANPTFEKCMEALDVVRARGVTFLLAVGGGSVIDAAKFIALSSYCKEGESPWGMMVDNASVPAEALPLGTVCTIPAAGSEMNNGFVISRAETNEKLTCGSFLVCPRFSVLDPETTYSLPPKQLRNGLVDIVVHVLEQYVTVPADAPLQDRQAEAILSTIFEIADAVMSRTNDYASRASMMWCAAQAMNGVINRGIVMDWSTHEIGHWLTALYNLDHAETLAITQRGVWENQFRNKQDKLARFGERVWGFCGSKKDVAQKAIDATEKFFLKIGMGTRFSDYGIDAEKAARAVSEACCGDGKRTLGEHKAIDRDAVYSILMSRR